MFIVDATLGTVAGTRATIFGIAAIRAAKLRHKALDHPVKVQAIIKAALGKFDEVAGGLRHLINEKFDFHVTQ